MCDSITEAVHAAAAGSRVVNVRLSDDGALELAGAMRAREEAHELERWRAVFGSAELVADGVQSELWLGDVDTPPALTLEEITQQVREEADRA